MERLINLMGNLDRVYTTLLEHLPWSPLDFIPELSQPGDRAIYIRHLTRPLEIENDLRFIYRPSTGDELAVFAERLPWDSNFFGYGIAKLEGIYPLLSPAYQYEVDYTQALSNLIGKARKRGIKYLFSFVEPRDLPLLRGLGQLGFSVIETRVFYHMDVRNYEHKERYSVRSAYSEDIESLGTAARETVNPYDRFHSDPFIRITDADRLMYKWVEASILKDFADYTLVPAISHPKAFCTIRYHKEKWTEWGLNLSQLVLSAVAPEFKGWYRKLISEFNYHICTVGADHAYLSTQITNKRVIGVLEKLGYRFGKGQLVHRLVL